MSTAAARLGDPISHSSAMGGLLTGLAVGAGVALAGVAVVTTGGLAAAPIMATVAAVGAGASAGAGIGQLLGSLKAMSSETGKITSASPNVSINGIPAARASADHVDCSKHSHGLKVIAEGSGGVRINGFPAARVGDRTACDAKISSGSSNVNIGGGTVQTDEINPEVPAWLEWTIAGVGLASAFALASPAVVTMGLLGGAGGGAGGHWVGGQMFGDGSDGQKLMTLGGAMLGGVAGSKGGAALNSRFRNIPTNTGEGIKASSRPHHVSSRRQYLNERFGRTGDLHQDITIRGRKETARNFFREQGISDMDARNYMNGLDFAKPVHVETLNSNKPLWQYQAPGAPQGKWYTHNSNVKPEQLGINPMGENRAAGTVVPKISNKYFTGEKIKVLQSTSAPVNDTWSVRGTSYPAPGGGKQIMTPSQKIFGM